ncbi:MAG TPA: DMT family transporter [Burkholderiaceae bacterium]|nr:DMT family transporter [Burkholderiaceae bacterium]
MQEPTNIERAAGLVPALALTFNALVWGTSWWPLRALQAHGWHPLWATALIYGGAVALIVLIRPRALLQLVRTPSLWVLVLAAGTTNASFNWGVVVGDVVRVLLLFYLMPLWAVLLAKLLLDEPITPHAGVRVALALGGAAIVLWPAGGDGWAALPVPRALPDWLGVIGGFAFALNNVMLRREATRPAEGRALAMFGGGALVSCGLAALLTAQGSAVSPPPALPTSACAIAATMVLLFLAGNLSLQYGASRLRASVTAVVMLTEIVFGAISSIALGAGVLTPPLLLGGALIFAAALLSAFDPTAAH